MRNYLIVIVAVVVLSGCGGGSGRDRVVLSGTVSYQGEPVETGSIRFVPISGTKGPASGAVIQDGTYETKARGGVPVGSHRVEIKATRLTGEPKPPELQGLDLMPEPMEQYVPDKYNAKSELTVTVEPDGDPTHNFDLE